MGGTLPFHSSIPTKWMEELICAFLNKKKTAVLKMGSKSNQGEKIKFTVAVLFNQNPISLFFKMDLMMSHSITQQKLVATILATQH